MKTRGMVLRESPAISDEPDDDATLIAAFARIEELEAQVNGLTQDLLRRDSAITAAIEQRDAAEAQLAEANERIAKLEADLLEASELLEKPIGHFVGRLCVAEAVRVVLAQLAEANRERERANLLAQDLIGGLQQRLSAAEAREAKLRKFAGRLWERLNGRRCLLITREQVGNSSDAEHWELNDLQKLADESVSILTPLPIAELEQYMREHGVEIPAQDALQPPKEKTND